MPYIVTSSGRYIEIESPKNITDDELSYISGFIEELEAAASSVDGVNPVTKKSIFDYLDVDSWVDKYLLENMFQNVDSDYDSCYFYKKSDSEGGKLVAGPAWDYDRTATNAYNIWDTNRVGSLYLCDELLNIDAIRSVVEDTFQKKVKPYVMYKLSSKMYDLFEANHPSYLMNGSLWGFGDKFGTDYENIDIFVERTKLRLQVIDGKILGNNKDHIVTFIDYEGRIIKTEYVKHGMTISEIPVCSSWWALFNGWIDSSNGERLYENTPIYKDTEYFGDWVNTSLMIKNGLYELGIDYSAISEESIETLSKYYYSQMED